MNAQRRLSLLLLLLLVVFAGVAYAQEATGNIDGRVVDASGAAVPGAEVTALHVETGTTRKAATNSEGSYMFTALPVGTYQISALHAGFKKAVKTGIPLHINDRTSIDMRLELGDLAQEVSVAANREQVQTESSEQSGLITGDQIRNLQLNGRSFLTLLELVPGVASELPDRTDPNTNVLLNINGARNTQGSFNIDGGGNEDLTVGSRALNTFTSVDTIAEFKILTTGFSAEYGRGGFSQINVVTKSGSKDFHGSLHEFFRNDALDATDFFSHQVLPLRLNTPGYTIGGPVLLPFGYNRGHDKTFFFFSQDFNRLTQQAAAQNTTVPTAAQRRGDFSALAPGAMVDPTTNAAFPNGIIPASRLDPNALKMINLYPLPNFAGPGSINYTSAAPGHQNWREELVRIDQNFSSVWKLFGRYAQDGATILNPYGGTLLSQIRSVFPGPASTVATRPGKNLTVNLTGAFSPTLLNEFRFTYSSRKITQALATDQLNRSVLGVNIAEIFPEDQSNSLPALTLSGYAAIAVPGVQNKQLFNVELADNFTKIRGRHFLKAGFLYSDGGNMEQKSTDTTNGSFSFTTGFTKNPVANLLLGLPASYSEQEHVLTPQIRFGVLEAYLQDDIRVNHRLTISLGLRDSNYFSPYEINNVLANFVPSLYNRATAPQLIASTGIPVPGSGDPLDGMIVAGKSSPWGQRVTPNNTNLLGPRAGFAWDIFGKKKTALRGGYGIYYTQPLIGSYVTAGESNIPFSNSVTIQSPPFSNPGGGTTTAAGVPNLTTMGTPTLAPTSQQWSFGIQQETPGNAILSVSYVGSHGTHLVRPININSAPAGAAAAQKVNVNAVLPYIGFGTITERQTSASSVYHSLQTSLKVPVHHGFMFGIAYTYSRSIDNGSTEDGNGDMPPNSYNIRAERGLSSFDRTQIFTSNFIWSVPKLARGPLARKGGRALLNGWHFSGIVREWSGEPLNVTMSLDVAGLGAVQNQRPSVIADPAGPRRVDQWFNIAAFARPATGTFGNLGRNTLRGPGVNKWDLTLYKDFALAEKTRLQFRSEFFNAFNHPSFTTIGTALNTTASGINPSLNNFGVTTATRDARVLQFALKLNF